MKKEKLLKKFRMAKMVYVMEQMFQKQSLVKCNYRLSLDSEKQIGTNGSEYGSGSAYGPGTDGFASSIFQSAQFVDPYHEFGWGEAVGAGEASGECRTEYGQL